MARRKTMRPMPWLRQRLRAVDATASDLARHLEVPPARVYEMIKGQRQFQPHEIAKAASFLKIGEGQFLKLIEGKLEAKDVTIDDVTALPWANTDVTSVPLLRTTLGPHGRWRLHVSRTEGAMVRPDFIRFSMTAFAIVVQDERNSPVYRARDRILINPESPVTPGDDVVLGSGNDLLTFDELHLIPGHLTERTAAGWTLKQYADGHQRSFSIEQFPAAWKIVSRFMPG